MSEPNRHHYIPIFYLMPWVGEDGRLCEYSAPQIPPAKKVVKARRKHPAGTAYIDGLYTIPGLPRDQAQFVEKRFLKTVDDWAAKALQLLSLPHNPRELTDREHVGWARFLFSLMLRNPEQMTRFEAEAVKRQYPGPVQALLPDFINSVPVISVLVQQMSFHTLQIEAPKHTFLTSDRPIIMTNGLVQDDAHIVIPISPTRLFIAVRNRKLADTLVSVPRNDLVWSVNNKVAEQAIEYVYGVDDSQLRFVANRLGKRVQSTPLG